jgi:hypothetical protein
MRTAENKRARSHAPSSRTSDNWRHMPKWGGYIQYILYTEDNTAHYRSEALPIARLHSTVPLSWGNRAARAFKLLS